MDAHCPSDLNATYYEEARKTLEQYHVEIVEYIEPINYSYLLALALEQEEF